MSGETPPEKWSFDIPEHWSFDNAAHAQWRLRVMEFTARLGSLASLLGADDPDHPGDDVVTGRHVARAASLLLRAHVPSTTPRYHVFISYKSEDEEIAGKIQQKLGKKDLRGFLASVSIESGLDWEEAVFQALRECDVVLFVVTHRLKSSDWCNYEVGAARALGKEVVCALRDVDASELPAALRRFQAAAARTPREVNQLISIVKDKCSIEPRPPRPPQRRPPRRGR